MSYRTGDTGLDTILNDMAARLARLERGDQYAHGTMSAKAVRVGSMVLSQDQEFQGVLIHDADTGAECFLPVPCPPAEGGINSFIQVHGTEGVLFTGDPFHSLFDGIGASTDRSGGTNPPTNIGGKVQINLDGEYWVWSQTTFTEPGSDIASTATLRTFIRVNSGNAVDIGGFDALNFGGPLTNKLHDWICQGGQLITLSAGDIVDVWGAWTTGSADTEILVDDVVLSLFWVGPQGTAGPIVLPS